MTGAKLERVQFLGKLWGVLASVADGSVGYIIGGFCPKGQPEGLGYLAYIFLWAIHDKLLGYILFL